MRRDIRTLHYYPVCGVADVMGGQAAASIDNVASAAWCMLRGAEDMSRLRVSIIHEEPAARRAVWRKRRYGKYCRTWRVYRGGRCGGGAGRRREEGRFLMLRLPLYLQHR